jgi:hypothetical protein
LWQIAALKEAALESILSITWKKWRLAGAVCLSSAGLAASAMMPAVTLSATQLPTAVYLLPQATDLRVPADITEEQLERVVPDAAAAIGPLLRTLFDSSEPADARLAAADELQVKIAELDATAPGTSSIQRRLVRRVRLVAAFLRAAQVENPLGDISATRSALNGAASSAIDWLSSVKNGELWVSFLRLDELQAAEVSTEIVTSVAAKFSANDDYTDEQASFMQRPQIVAVNDAVNASIAASAVADDDAMRTNLQSVLSSLLESILENESDQLAASADTARTAYRTLREQFPGAAAVVRPIMLDDYINYNVHFTMSEVLLSRLVSDYRTETGCIADCILGAWVTGSQVTDVNVTADVRPSTDRAQFNLVVNGNTRSNTAGRKKPATVYTQGNHFFTINKPVWIDGEHVTSGPGNIHVDVNNRTVGIRTDYDGIPLIGALVRKIAAQKVAESRGQAESIARRKLADEALPQFNEEASKQLNDMDTELHDKLLNGLRDKGIAPDTISARSSNTHIAVSSRTVGETRLGGSSQPPLSLSTTGLTIQIHESALNNSVDALGLNGRTLKEDEVVGEIENSLSEILQRDISFSKDDKEAEPTADGDEPAAPSTFVFSKTDPIRVMFGDGTVTLVMRTGVLQEGKEDIPEQVIEIPISLTMEGGLLILDPGRIRVTSVTEANRTKQVLRANQVRRILSRKFPRKELDPSIELQNASDQEVQLTLQNIAVSDGWLTAEMK